MQQEAKQGTEGLRPTRAKLLQTGLQLMTLESEEFQKRKGTNWIKMSHNH